MSCCGAQTKGFEHPCCHSPDKEKSAENFERAQRERATFASWHSRRPKTAAEWFLLLCRPSGWATSRGGKHGGEGNSIFCGTHLESTLPPKQTHKAGQEAANLFDYYLGHFATFQFSHLHLWHNWGERGPFQVISPTRSVPFRKTLPP